MKPIAIIGIGCRFPKADGPEAFWKLLLERKDAVTSFPEERRRLSRLFDRVPPEAAARFFGGFLEGIEKFDPDFFGITSREAHELDPQQRILMEIAWQALEDAGLVPSRLKGSRAGVFIGTSTREYSIRSFLNPSLVTPYTGTGNSSSILANRLSYFFDLRGPSLAVDTACSSSLVAVHLACRYLQEEGATLALAGGVNLILSPVGNEVFQQAKALAQDGRCKAFDASADGFVRSEGAGIVILKPLDRAIADGDSIYGVIRGSAVNQDGRTNGLMAPNRWAQEKVLKEALQDAGVEPEAVQYVEAHGTGTLLGDPIEATALGSVYSAERDPAFPLRLGSVKTNIGHAESAAGIAGLIKVALSMRHRLIPPSIHFRQPNPYIDFDKLKLKVQSEPTEWSPAEGRPALAGISSFGFGGTNAHLVLERFEAPASKPAAPPRFPQPRLFPISARDERSLRQVAKSWAEHLATLVPSSGLLESLAYSSACLRTHFESRTAFVAGNVADLQVALERFAAGEGTAHEPQKKGAKRPVVFVFSGQGSQWTGMAASLLEREPAFRRKMTECDAAIQAEAGWSPLSELTRPNPDFESRIERIQPILFSISVSLAEVFAHWGVQPDVTIGHSMGEVAAAHVAGMLSLADAVKVICRRSRWMASLRGEGAMALVEMTRAEAQAIVERHGKSISVAASNGPRSVVLSGDRRLIESIVAELSARNVFAKLVKVDVASHSSQVDPILDEIRGELRELAPTTGRCRLYSTVLNRFIEGPALDAEYWAANLRQPVSFFESVSALISGSSDCFVELSPHPLLASAIEETASSMGTTVCSIASLRRAEDEPIALLRALGALFEAGVALAWENAFDPKPARAGLPHYPWNRQTFWLDEDTGTSPMAAMAAGLQGAEIPSPDARKRRAWSFTIGGNRHAYLLGHRVQDTPVFPGTGYVELAVQMASRLLAGAEFTVRKLQFQRALFLEAGRESELQLVLSPLSQSGGQFEIFSRTRDHRATTGSRWRWELNASGSVERTDGAALPARLDLDSIRQTLSHQAEVKSFYSQLASAGQHYEGAFQGIQTLYHGPAEALAELSFPTLPSDELSHYLFHPAVLDSCLQGLLAIGSLRAEEAAVWLKSIDRVSWRPGAGPMIPRWSYLEVDARTKSAKATLLDAEGRVLAVLEGIRHERVVQQTGRFNWPKRRQDWLYDIRWEPSPVDASARTSFQPDVWLLFSDRGGLGRRLTPALGNTPVLLIRPGKQYRRFQDSLEWEIDPARPEHFSRLFSELKRQIPRDSRIGIVHLLSLDQKGQATPATSRLPCVSLLHLMKAMEKRSSYHEHRLWVVTSGAQAVGDATQAFHPFQSPMWGLCRSLIEECHDQFARLIDLSPEAPVADNVEALAQEIRSGDSEQQVVYREGKRFGPRLVRIFSRQGEPLPVRLRPERTYLVTGGLGKLGLLAARWMIGQGARHLLIFGRTPLPPRHRWSELTPRHPAYDGIRSVRDLEELGCEVDYRAVDVAERSQVDAVLREYRARLKPEIAGVIHAAGIVYAKPFTEMSPRELETVFRAKIDGTWNLHQAFGHGSGLEWMVTYSSFSSWVSSPYLAAYAAANSFLNALMEKRRRDGLPGIALNWGTWAGTGSAEHGDRGTFQGIGTLPQESGMLLLEELLGSARLQAGIAVVDWKSLKSHYPRLGESRFLQAVMSEVSSGSEAGDRREDGGDRGLRESLEGAQGAARVELIGRYLAKAIARAVRRAPEEIPLHQPLNTLGLDSLIALEIKNAISRDVGVTVPVVQFLKGTSALELAEYLAKSLEKSSLSHRRAERTRKGFGIDLEELGEAELDQLIRHLEPPVSRSRKRRAA